MNQARHLLLFSTVMAFAWSFVMIMGIGHLLEVSGWDDLSASYGAVAATWGLALANRFWIKNPKIFGFNLIAYASLAGSFFLL